VRRSEMSKKRTGQAPPGPKPEQAPITIERAEQCVPFVNFDWVESKDLVEVVVVAGKTARALQLAIGGLRKHCEHSEPRDEDFDLLDEMAMALWLVCEQTKDLVAEGQAAAAPAPESPAQSSAPERKPGHLHVIDGGGPRPAA
jgi:hypothetical protein